MKTVILAGGYAKRLEPLTTHIPKSLLPIDGRPIIDFAIRQIDEITDIDTIIVSTNIRFKNHFSYWLDGFPRNVKSNVKIVVEPTTKEEEKLGAIGGLRYLIEIEKLNNDDLLVVAGDNIFDSGMSPIEYHQMSQGISISDPNQPLVKWEIITEDGETKDLYHVPELLVVGHTFRDISMRVSKSRISPVYDILHPHCGEQLKIEIKLILLIICTPLLAISFYVDKPPIPIHLILCQEE